MPFDNKKDLRKKFGPRKNEWIRVPEVQLIDEKGENVGVVSTSQALRMAQEVGLDLVEVSTNVTPPVCKIMDYAKYMYLQNKKSRSNKKGKAKETKEFRFTAVIDKADIQHRVDRAKEYITKGHPVKLTMFIKGRQNREQAAGLFNEILTNFADYSSIEPSPTKEGNNISITYKPDGKTKNKQNGKEEV